MLNRVVYIKVVTLFLYLNTICGFLAGQNNITSKIRVLRGSNLSFNFNSYNRYSSGIIYQNFTQLQLYFKDTLLTGGSNPSSSGWQLTTRAIQSSISGGMTIYDLPLNSILLYVNMDGAEHGPFTLNATELQLVKGTDNDLNKTIEISYYCGTNADNNMINKFPDNYVVDIEFTLKPQ